MNYQCNFATWKVAGASATYTSNTGIRNIHLQVNKPNGVEQENEEKRNILAAPGFKPVIFRIILSN